MVNLDNNPPRLMVDPDTKSKEIAATSGNVDDNAKTSLLKETRLELSLRVQALDNKEVQGGPGDLASMEACLALMAAPPGQPRDLATLGAVASWKARLCKKAKTYCSENASPRGGSERQGEDPAAKGTN
ncbi:MAG TPA: hypothetical protein PKC28_15620 [Bdellovibrionales bacterium]|nr:hypothetical protein [Bdellovibrionales bacterium]